MTAKDFVAELDREVAAALTRIGEAAAAPPASHVTVAALLTSALRNELEAAEEAALWLVKEADVEVKLALARQCGDEAKHYRLIQDRLAELGVDVAALQPLAEGRTSMYQFLQGLESTVERIAAGPFAREALAGVRNEAFIAHCESAGDSKTAALYRDIVQPDEAFHHQMGRILLLKLATDDATQASARRATGKTLELAGEMQEIARLKKGFGRAPGC